MPPRAPVDLILSGCRLVGPREVLSANICIDDGRIFRFAKSGALPKADEVVKLPARSLVLPGVVDVHAHLRDLELSHKGTFESESQAAASGGVTFAVDMPNSRPPTLSAADLDHKRRLAEGRVAVDFGINLGVWGNEEELARPGEHTAFGEIFVGPSTEGPVVGYEELGRYLAIISRTGKPACIHAEDPALFTDGGEPYDHGQARPSEAEARAIEKVLSLNISIGARLHFCHVSTRRALEIISTYRSRGCSVTCEVTPHHLSLADESYRELGPHAKMNPPLRNAADLRAITEAVRSGVIDIIASDHAPHSAGEKSDAGPGCPSGVPGFETMIPAVMTHFEEAGIPPSTFVRMARTTPSEVFGIPGKGFGRGMDADLVVLETRRRRVDPDAFLSLAKYSPFSGQELKYWPIRTLLRGQTIFDDGEVTVKNSGRFIAPRE